MVRKSSSLLLLPVLLLRFLFSCHSRRDIDKGSIGEFSNNQMRSMNMMLANQFASIAMGYAATTQQERPAAKKAAKKPATHPVPPVPAVATNIEKDNDDPEFNRIYHHTIQNATSPKSVSRIYQEYYGEGSFKDVPVVGGLQGLEDKYGMKWRSGCAFQKSFQ